jgi:error-prone DNA polymerase
MAWRESIRQLYRERHLLGLTVSGHPLAELRPWLDARGYATARGLRELAAGAAVRVAGEVVLVHTPPMRSGQRVFFTTIEDETGLVDLALFPRHQPGNGKVLLEEPLVLVRGRLNRRGRRDILVVAEAVARPPLKLPGRKRAAPRGE